MDEDPTAALGSAEAWRNVAAAFLSTFVVFGVAYSFGTFFEPMAEEFAAGSGAISLVFSITSFVYFMLGPVTGPLVDRFGPRPVLLFGVGYGGFIALNPAVVAEAFGVVGLGAIVGVLYTSAGIGSLIGPPVAGLLIDATGTYTWAIVGAMSCAAAAAAVLIPLGNLRTTA